MADRGDAAVPGAAQAHPASSRGPFEDWRARGRLVEVERKRVFVVDTGAPAAGERPALCILHGFPSWSGDFALVVDALAARFRVIVHDHIGFGLSDKPARGYGYSLMEQADVAVELWRSLGVERMHLLAHDYGTSVCTEVLARRERGLLPLEVGSVTLTNGSVHLELAHLRIAQKILRSRLGPLYVRFATRGLFVRNMRRILRRPVEAEHLDAMYLALEHNGGRAVLPAVSQYLDERMRFMQRFVGALERLDVPAHVLWADDDPVAVRAIGDQLAREIPNAEHTRLPGVGHYPMLEDPGAWGAAVLRFLDGVNVRGAAPARA